MTGGCSGRRRTARSAVFAALLTATAVAGHVLAGGMAPSARVVAVSLVAALAAGWWLSARPRRLGVVAVAAVAGQLALHLAFSLGMSGGAHRPLLATLLCAHRSAAPSGSMGAMGSMASMAPPAGLRDAALMLGAHCAAAAVLVLWARRGEELATRVVALARSGFRRPPARPRPAVVARRPAPVVPRVDAVRLELLLPVGLTRRGPPLRSRALV